MTAAHQAFEEITDGAAPELVGAAHTGVDLAPGHAVRAVIRRFGQTIVGHDIFFSTNSMAWRALALKGR